MKEQIFLQASRFSALINGTDVNLPNKNLTEASLSAKIANALSITFGILGAISVLVITLAGIQYIMSGGDPQKTAKAKDTIMYAVIGLAVSILAFTIVSFVIGRIG